MVDELLDNRVTIRLGCRLRLEARDVDLIERDDRLDDILHIERGLVSMCDQGFCNNQEIVEQE